MKRLLADARKYWKAVLAFLLLPLFGGWLADESRDLLYKYNGWKQVDGRPEVMVPASLALTGLAALLAVWAGRDLFRPRDSHFGFKREPAPHPHLVLFLSNLDTTRGRWLGNGVPAGLDLTGDLDQDLATMSVKKKDPPEGERVRWAWEMPLRGLAHHRSALRSVTLVCSAESLKQAHWFAALLTGTYKAAFPLLEPGQVRVLLRSGAGAELSGCPADRAGCAALPPATGWDFEVFDELFTGLEAMLQRFDREGKPERDVVLDLTGGQKPNSVVAALLTVNRQAKFQYVQTNDPCRVIAYDLIADNAAG